MSKQMYLQTFESWCENHIEDRDDGFYMVDIGKCELGPYDTEEELLEDNADLIDQAVIDDMAAYGDWLYEQHKDRLHMDSSND